MLFGEGVRERGTGEETPANDDFAQAAASPRLLFERLRKLGFREQTGGNENPAELRGWKLGRVHDSSIGSLPRECE
ncbi:MAG TPA: hypothetical protein VF002_08750 [Gaiellaceae bacterium]